MEQYTVSLIPEASGFPVILLKMQEEQEQRLPFCNLLKGVRSTKIGPGLAGCFLLTREAGSGDFHFIANPSFCLGLKEKRESTVQEYLEGQGLAPTGRTKGFWQNRL